MNDYVNIQTDEHSGLLVPKEIAGPLLSLLQSEGVVFLPPFPIIEAAMWEPQPDAIVEASE